MHPQPRRLARNIAGVRLGQLLIDKVQREFGNRSSLLVGAICSYWGFLMGKSVSVDGVLRTLAGLVVAVRVGMGGCIFHCGCCDRKECCYWVICVFFIMHLCENDGGVDFFDCGVFDTAIGG